MPSEIKNDPLVLVSINGEGVVAPARVAARMQQRAEASRELDSLSLLADGFVAGVAYLVAQAAGASKYRLEAAIRVGANIGNIGVSLGAHGLPSVLSAAPATFPIQRRVSRPTVFEHPYKMGDQRALAKHEIFKAELTRWMEKPRANDKNLARCVDTLFKDSAIVRNGSTASAVRYERQTGEPVGHRFHENKANNELSFLKRWIDANPASNNDRMVAEVLARDLLDALSTPTFPGYFANVRAHRQKKEHGPVKE